MKREKDFGFAAAMTGAKPTAHPEPAPSVDLSGFDEDTVTPAVDHQAAKVAEKIAQGRGFTSRAGVTPRNPAKTAPRPEKPASRRQRVRMAEVVAREPEARADEDRAQLNINAPVSVVRRFKELERRQGARAWQLLERMLDHAEAMEVARK